MRFALARFLQILGNKLSELTNTARHPEDSISAVKYVVAVVSLWFNPAPKELVGESLFVKSVRFVVKKEARTQGSAPLI